MIIVAGNFCTQCGYENSPERGACLMCYAMLKPPGQEATCSACGASNPAASDFCQQCGAALSEAVNAVPGVAVQAAVIAESLDAGLGGGGPQPGAAELESPEFAEEIPAAVEAAGVGEEAAAISAMDTMEAQVPAPPAEVEQIPEPEALGADSEELAATVEEELAAPPPPPGAIELEEETEEFAPPPPPPDALSVDEIEVEPAAKEEFAPPPPPPDVVSLEEEEAEAPEEEPEGWGLTS